jgi:hypothetical protein
LTHGVPSGSRYSRISARPRRAEAQLTAVASGPIGLGGATVTGAPPIAAILRIPLRPPTAQMSADDARAARRQQVE